MVASLSRVVPAPRPAAARPHRSGLPFAPIGSFAREERGALTIFGLFIFFMMLVAAGIAIDTVRSEVHRARLQYTIDRASLAAASLTQEEDSREVVKNYLRAAGLDEDLAHVTFTETRFEKRVAIEANSEINSLFMDAFKRDALIQSTSSRARQMEAELELSLVLDVSGSMEGSRLTTLKEKAKTFVKKLLEDRETLTTISIVPYDDHVNLGANLAAHFPITQEHTASHCIVFDEPAPSNSADSDFHRLGLRVNPNFPAIGTGRYLPVQRKMHFDAYDHGYWRYVQPRYSQGYWEFVHQPENAPGLVSSFDCEDEGDPVVAWSNDLSTLEGSIEALTASGNTAIDLGVKVGALLLDPSMRDTVSAIVAARTQNPGDATIPVIDPAFRQRPNEYGTENLRKVLVVMTDGANTNQNNLKSAYWNGPSGVFVHRHGTTSDADLAARLEALRDESGWFQSWEWNDPDAPAEPWHTEARLTEIVELLDTDRTGDGEVDIADYRYSFWSPTEEKFYIPHADRYNRWKDQPSGLGDAIELSYAELFAIMPIHFLQYEMLRNAGSATRNHYINVAWRTQDNGSANSNLQNICTAARQSDIVIYAIAFDAGTDGEAAMKRCAGDGLESRYFDVDDQTNGLEDAFDEILAGINELRLIP